MSSWPRVEWIVSSDVERGCRCQVRQRIYASLVKQTGLKEEELSRALQAVESRSGVTFPSPVDEGKMGDTGKGRGAGARPRSRDRAGARPGSRDRARSGSRDRAGAGARSGSAGRGRGRGRGGAGKAGAGERFSPLRSRQAQQSPEAVALAQQVAAAEQKGASDPLLHDEAVLHGLSVLGRLCSVTVTVVACGHRSTKDGGECMPPLCDCPIPDARVRTLSFCPASAPAPLPLNAACRPLRCSQQSP